MENEHNIQELYEHLRYSLYLSQHVEGCTTEICQLVGRSVSETRKRIKELFELNKHNDPGM